MRLPSVSSKRHYYDHQYAARQHQLSALDPPKNNRTWLRRCIWNLLIVVVFLSLLDSLYCREHIFRSPADRLIAKFDASTYRKLDGEHGHNSMARGSDYLLGDHIVPTYGRSRRRDSALIMLCRNEDLHGVIQSMTELEKAFNSKYHYPWIFFNDVPFTDHFISQTRNLTKGKVSYELIPREHWEVPSRINMDMFHVASDHLRTFNVKYAASLSYRQMCRWNSGFFYKHPALAKIKYYWRVEPDVNFYSDIKYDPFQYMAENDISYGFNLAVLDSPRSIPSLWPSTLEFLGNDRHKIHPNSSWSWLISDTINSEIANGYSTCHFWSNFEIADLDFFRSEIYEEYFQHLDRSNGFFYERWGDAPVHSIAVGLFLDKRQIHWFHDHGYKHHPYANCPNEPGTKRCTQNIFAPGQPWLNVQDCRASWFKNIGIV